MNSPLKLSMHRVQGKPEWETVAPDRRNIWQNVAARSSGIITVGNYFSLLGLLSVPFGLSLVLDDHIFAGIAVLLLGRFCDMLDGFLADRTGTKSPLGEKIDAVFDKLSTALLVVVLAAGMLVPLWVLALVVLPQILMAALALRVYLRSSIMHPSRFGKLSMAAGWLTLLAFLAVPDYPGSVWMYGAAVAFLLLGVAVFLSVVALFGYHREHRQLLRGH
jgi:cardiolipin synthase